MMSRSLLPSLGIALLVGLVARGAADDRNASPPAQTGGES